MTADVVDVGWLALTCTTRAAASKYHAGPVRPVKSVMLADGATEVPAIVALVGDELGAAISSSVSDPTGLTSVVVSDAVATSHDAPEIPRTPVRVYPRPVGVVTP